MLGPTRKIVYSLGERKSMRLWSTPQGVGCCDGCCHPLKRQINCISLPSFLLVHERPKLISASAGLHYQRCVWDHQQMRSRALRKTQENNPDLLPVSWRVGGGLEKACWYQQTIMDSLLRQPRAVNRCPNRAQCRSDHLGDLVHAVGPVRRLQPVSLFPRQRLPSRQWLPTNWRSMWPRGMLESIPARDRASNRR